jgi:dihydroorotase
MEKITLVRPDDWHLHVRDQAAMASVIGASAQVFGRAIIMPNLKPPVVTVAQALAYRARIIAALPPASAFQPLMTLYLTDNTRPEEIAALKDSGEVVAVKYYPAGATTNSDAGVTDLRKVWAVLEAMQNLDVPLLIHGEVTTPSVDIFDREYCFIRHVLDPLLDALPDLRVVLEHITTREAVDYVLAGEDRLGATITAHHLLMNRNDLFQGGVRPHHYCLPVLKREVHRQALLSAIASGSPRFFLGTDSAPHAQGAKENACGCAGMYTAPAALPLYAEAFEECGALAKLEAFASFHGADFYRLPRNQDHLTLLKQPWLMPTHFAFGAEHVIPLRAGDTIAWQLAS